jgi:hypothetical protein
MMRGKKSILSHIEGVLLDFMNENWDKMEGADDAEDRETHIPQNQKRLREKEGVRERERERMKSRKKGYEWLAFTLQGLVTQFGP